MAAIYYNNMPNGNFNFIYNNKIIMPMQSDPSNRSKVEILSAGTPVFVLPFSHFGKETAKIINTWGLINEQSQTSYWVTFHHGGKWLIPRSKLQTIDEYHSLPPSGEEETAVGWISVKDRLPKQGERVLCSTIYGVQIGWLTVKGDWQFTNMGSQFNLKYWMPLPELPAELFTSSI